MDFPAVAKATTQTGIPVYYRGEENREFSGLYHPPLYIYLLAGWYKVFGFSETATRLFGTVMAILQCFIVIKILARLLPTLPVQSHSGFFYALFLLSPFTLANSSIADIDSTIYGPLLLILIFAVVRTVIPKAEAHRHMTLTEFSTVFLLLVIAGWAKLTSVLLLLPFVAIVFALAFGPLRGLILSALGLLISGLGFAFSYSLYGKLLHLDTDYTYRFLLYSFLGKGSLGAPTLNDKFRRLVTTLGYNVSFHSVWLGGLTILLVGYSLCVLFRDCRRSWGITSRLLFVVFLLPLAAILTYFSLTMPWAQSPSKYIFPFFALFLAPIYCALLAFGLDQLTSICRFGIQYVYSIAFVIGTTVIRDRLLWRPPNSILPDPWSAALATIWIPALIALVGIVLWFVLKNQNERVPLSKALFIFTVVANAGLLAGVAAFQARTPYSTTYSYGQLGIREAAFYVRSKTAENEPIICMKDVGFLADRPYWESYNMLSSAQSADELIGKVKNGQVRYLVFTRNIGEDRLDAYPELQRQILSVADEEWHYANYVVFRAKQKEGVL